MKTFNLVALALSVALTVSSSSFARGGFGRNGFKKPELTPVSWQGTFQCDEKIHTTDHSKEHICDLQFVNAESGEEWNVESNPALDSLHQKLGGPVTARIDAKRSPRYLLGGSYIEVAKIEVPERGTALQFVRNPKVEAQPTFRWVGTVQDDENVHTTEHGHNLRFTRLDDGEQFNIVDSPQLVKAHCEGEKNYIVEIDAEKTPKFLFWGGNLIVKNFRIVEPSLAKHVPHYSPEDVMPSRIYEHSRL